MDLDHDEYREGDPLKLWQQIALDTVEKLVVSQSIISKLSVLTAVGGTLIGIRPFEGKEDIWLLGGGNRRLFIGYASCSRILLSTNSQSARHDLTTVHLRRSTLVKWA